MHNVCVCASLHIEQHNLFVSAHRQELIHLFVEVLDGPETYRLILALHISRFCLLPRRIGGAFKRTKIRYFGNVCELDLVFHFDKAGTFAAAAASRALNAACAIDTETTTDKKIETAKHSYPGGLPNLRRALACGRNLRDVHANLISMKCASESS